MRHMSIFLDKIRLDERGHMFYFFRQNEIRRNGLTPALRCYLLTSSRYDPHGVAMCKLYNVIGVYCVAACAQTVLFGKNADG